MNPEDRKIKDTSKNHHRDQNNLSLQSNFDIYSFFKRDSDFVFLCKKTEKISSALYLLTNLMPDSEPIKWNLRNLSLKLLSYVVSLKNGLGNDKEQYGEKIRSCNLEITSLLEVAMYGNLLSGMNVSIVKRELFALLSHIEKPRPFKKNHTPFIEDTFFNISSEESSPLGDKTQIRTDVSSSRTNFPQSIKDNFSHLSGVGKIPAHLKEFGPIAVKKNQRKSIIIGLIKRKKQIMIKDVAGALGNWSEKTIQRELSALVQEGVLKRVGERRWSKYSLAK